MEQLVILLLIGLISFINWIIRKSAEAREKRKLEERLDRGEEMMEPPPVPEPAAKGDASESMRRLMEALGLPEDAMPPAVPAREKVELPPPLPPVLPRVQQPGAPQKTSSSPASLHERAMAFQAAATKSTMAKSGFRKLLSSPEGLRDGVILSEILGTPKALR